MHSVRVITRYTVLVHKMFAHRFVDSNDHRTFSEAQYAEFANPPILLLAHYMEHDVNQRQTRAQYNFIPILFNTIKANWIYASVPH